MSDLISIIVPVYNSYKYLRKCIDSLIQQSFENIEIILIDDGSTDGSGKLCDEYGNIDSRVKVIHKKNGGLSSARNAGMNIAIGKYIMFCDSDDIVSSKWCEHLHSAISAYPNALALCASCNFEKDLGLVFEKEHKTEDYFQVSYDKIINFKSIGIGFAWNKIYVTQIIKDNNLNFRTIESGNDFNEDLVFTIDYLKYVKYFVIANHRDYCYFIRNNSLSNGNKQPRLERYFEKYNIWKEYIIIYCYGNTEYLNDIANNTLYQIVSFLSIEASGKCISPTEKFIECVKSETLHDVILSINKPQENIRIIEAIKEKNYNKLWRILKISNIKRRIKK